MKFFRGLSLVVIPAYILVSMCPALVAQQPPGQPPAQQPPQQQQQTPPATPPKASPFETIPAAPAQPAPPPAATPAAPAAQPGQRPQLETPKEAPIPAVNPNGQVIESFEFRGAKRVPQDTLKALIISKPGD